MTTPEPLQRPQSSCSGKQEPLKIRWKSDGPSNRTKRKQSVRAARTTPDASSQNSQDGQVTADARDPAVCDELHATGNDDDNIPSPASGISSTGSAPDERCKMLSNRVDDDSVEEVGPTSEAIQICPPNSISPWIPPLNFRTRMFLSHCRQSLGASVHWPRAQLTCSSRR